MLNTLITNEIKDASGVEVEFEKIKTLIGSGTEWQKVNDSPAVPHHMTISHQETGSGTSRRRRSVIRFDKTIVGTYDTTKNFKNSCYVVLDRAIGNEPNSDVAKLLLANLMSFLATTGAATTVLFDCTGTGASNLLSGGI